MRIAAIFKHSFSKLFGERSAYPLRIALENRSRPNYPLLFDAHSAVEEYRIAEYGGEKDFLQQFLGSLRPEDVVFDIGASVGLIAIHAASLFDTVRVVAFEPDPETFAHLKDNVALNLLNNVDCIDWAVSDRAEETLLYTDGASGFAPSMRPKGEHFGAPTNFQFHQVVTVRAKSLDEAIFKHQIPLPTVLKIDVEGAEALCLRGATQLLSGELGDRPRLLFLEVHPEFLPAFESNVDDVERLLLNKGYAIAWHYKRHAQLHYCFAC